jgi:MFS transporter, PAT family, beta-lactamase induction signal transducer AmpG
LEQFLSDIKPVTQAAKRSWLDAILVYRQRSIVTMLFLGFSSGLPFYLIFQTLSAWLRQEGIQRGTIGMMAWAGLMYTIKVLWSPLVDRVRIPFLYIWLGRRRSWMLVTQVGIGICLLNLAISDPSKSIQHVAIGAVLLAFCAATQDIAIDAWRIESAPNEQQGAMAAAYQLGYRAALIVGGAVALGLAGAYGWFTSYASMAACALIGVVTTFVAIEPDATVGKETIEREARVLAWLESKSHWPLFLRNFGEQFVASVVCPMTDFFSRYRVAVAVMVILFMGCFRIPEFILGSVTNPFYIDHGYTLGQISTYVKAVGLPVGMVGVVLGGLLIAKLGVRITLFAGGMMMIVSNLGFLALAQTHGPTLIGLAAVNAFDNLCYGIAGTSLIAFLSGVTNRRYTATQYALFSSIYALPGKTLEGFSGFIVDGISYTGFFIYAACLGIPALLLLLWLSKQQDAPEVLRRSTQP